MKMAAWLYRIGKHGGRVQQDADKRYIYIPTGVSFVVFIS